MSDQNDQIGAAPDADEPSSKTARKREADRLLHMGRRIGELNMDQIEGLDLPGELYQAIIDYRRFPSHGAKKRQLQFVGKLMRKLDVAAIEVQLADLDGESAQARYRFNQLEQWRDELIHDSDAVTRFISEYSDVDRQHLRQMIKKINATKDPNQQKSHAKALFRFLRETVEAQ